jgi:endonuclease YncB( thermonuclease family)
MDSRWRFALPFCPLLVVAASMPASAAKLFRGPVEATVIEVLDGDTFLAEALVWPGHTVTVNVRIRGIDAPEMRARCEAERLGAEKARDALSRLFGGDPVSISNISGAKYYGRVLADVTTADGQGVAPLLLGENLVRPYGGGRREPWCD